MSTTSAVYQRWSVRLSAFEDLTSKWKSVQLQSLQKEDERPLLTANREQLSASRRLVSTKTKAFAKFTAEEKTHELGGLVKSYQAHVDDLTRSLQHVESLYTDLLERVKAMTDPYPMMEKFAREKNTILDFVQTSVELDNVRRVVAEREAELQGLRNQEVTIADLREALAQAQRDRAEAMQRSVDDASNEWQRVLAEYQQRDTASSQQVAQAQQEATKWRLMHLSASDQVANLRARLDEVEALRERDIASLVEELDAANTALALKDRELRRMAEDMHANSKLNTSLPSESATPQRSSAAASLMLEEHIAELQQSNAKMETVLQAQQVAWAAERQDLLARAESEGKRAAAELYKQMEVLSSQLDGAHTEIANQRGHTKAVSEELQRTQHALRMAESELVRYERRQQPDEAVVEVGAPVEVQHSTTPAVIVSDEDTYIAVAAQRDRLRQRLLALEEASSQEIHRLQVELSELKSEQQASYRGLTVGSDHTNDDGGPEGRRPLLLYRQGKLNVTPEAIVDLLDRGNILLSRYVLANLQWRRGFVAYLALLHLYLVLSTLLDVLLG